MLHLTHCDHYTQFLYEPFPVESSLADQACIGPRLARAALQVEPGLRDTCLKG